MTSNFETLQSERHYKLQEYVEDMKIINKSNLNLETKPYLS